MYTTKWRNEQKRNDFLARKCIYQYLIKNGNWHKFRPIRFLKRFSEEKKYFVAKNI